MQHTLFAVIKDGGLFFVEPVLALDGTKCVVRLQRGIAAVEHFDVVHAEEDALRNIPKDVRAEICIAPPHPLAGTKTREPDWAERLEWEKWEAECQT